MLKWTLSPIELAIICLISTCVIVGCVLTFTKPNDNLSVEEHFMLQCELDGHTKTECKVLWKEYIRE